MKMYIRHRHIKYEMIYVIQYMLIEEVQCVMVYKTRLQHKSAIAELPVLTFTGIRDSKIQIITPYYKSRILHIYRHNWELNSRSCTLVKCTVNHQNFSWRYSDLMLFSIKKCFEIVNKDLIYFIFWVKSCHGNIIEQCKEKHAFLIF